MVAEHQTETAKLRDEQTAVEVTSRRSIESLQEQLVAQRSEMSLVCKERSAAQNEVKILNALSEGKLPIY